VKRTIDWVGDLGHLSSLDPGLQIAAPFWRWNAHILKSVLVTMPKTYPGRATLLQAMGEVGREYQREHGVWPSWLRGAIDLGDNIPGLGGKPGETTTVLPTSGIWPYATQTGVIAPDMDNAAIDPIAGLSNLSPVVTLPAAVAGVDASKLAKFKDANNKEIAFGSPEWDRLIAAKALGVLPTPYSTSGQASTSLPWDEQFKQNGLPRRGNSPAEIAMRAFGVGTTPVLTGGKPLLKQRAAAFKRAKTAFGGLSIEDRRAMLGAWRHDGGDTYSTIIDLGHGH
jgi:hypothetical protein